MNSKLTAGVVTALIVAIGAGLYVASNPDNGQNSDTESQQTTQTTMQSEPADNDVSQEYTLEDVAMHSTEDDCWTTINGSVYDLTSYIPRHPGSDNILSACGVDATSYFSGEQSGELGGTNDHTSSNSALNQLERLKIGTLKQ